MKCNCVYEKVCELREDTWGDNCPLMILGTKIMNGYVERYFGKILENEEKDNEYEYGAK